MLQAVGKQIDKQNTQQVREIITTTTYKHIM